MQRREVNFSRPIMRNEIDATIRIAKPE